MSSTILIRPAEPADARPIAHVQTESWRSTYKDIISADFLANMDVERRAAVWHTGLTNPTHRSCYFVAEDEHGQVIGFACGGPEHNSHPIYRSELFAIYILDNYQGQGIGRRLVQAVALWLHEHHYRNLLIWVLVRNPIGIGFYEALGGQRVDQKSIVIGGETLDEYGYGWLDIMTLLPAST